MNFHSTISPSLSPSLSSSLPPLSLFPPFPPCVSLSFVSYEHFDLRSKCPNRVSISIGSIVDRSKIEGRYQIRATSIPTSGPSHGPHGQSSAGNAQGPALPALRESYAWESSSCSKYRVVGAATRRAPKGLGTSLPIFWLVAHQSRGGGGENAAAQRAGGWGGYSVVASGVPVFAVASSPLLWRRGGGGTTTRCA